MSVQITTKDLNAMTEIVGKKNYVLVHDKHDEEDCVVESQESTSEHLGEEILPYSLSNELSFFFRKGLPLALSSLMKWGAPPWFAMIIAGHTKDSETLQSALGYGRVFYNCLVIMLLNGGCNYINTVIPGCIGAGRRDRIPSYFRRSLLMVLTLMIPSFVLQFFAAPVMAKLGVPADIASDLEVYCRLMIIAAVFFTIDLHLAAIFINLGYVRCVTFNAFITGVGVDVTCTYLLIYQYNLGMIGAGLSQIIVNVCRNLVWLLFMVYYGLTSTICMSPNSESIINAKEVSVFFKLAIPSILNNVTGWLIFELQILAMANIHGITDNAIAAGAIWMQSESVLGSIQTGWIQITMMRSLWLLGMKDPGAGKSYAILCVLSFIVVALCNIPFLVWGENVGRIVSNDPAVQWWFDRILWLLVLETQLRICTINGTALFVPMGKGALVVTVKFFCYYFIATPIGVVTALTDLVTTSVLVKLNWLLGSVIIGMVVVATFNFSYMALMDWKKVAKIIYDRAHMDK